MEALSSKGNMQESTITELKKSLDKTVNIEVKINADKY